VRQAGERTDGIQGGIGGGISVDVGTKDLGLDPAIEGRIVDGQTIVTQIGQVLVCTIVQAI